MNAPRGVEPTGPNRPCGLALFNSSYSGGLSPFERCLKTPARGSCPDASLKERLRRNGSPCIRCHTTFLPVAMAAGFHPFPFRTRPLSPPAPMVLRGQPRGRVGRRRHKIPTAPEDSTPPGPFLCLARVARRLAASERRTRWSAHLGVSRIILRYAILRRAPHRLSGYLLIHNMWEPF